MGTKLTILAAAMLVCTPGCNTLRSGGAGGLYTLAAAGQSGGGRGFDAEDTLFFFAFGAVIGGAVGLVEDIHEAVLWIDGRRQPGVTWDSPEGRRLRMMAGPAADEDEQPKAAALTDTPAASAGSSHR